METWKLSYDDWDLSEELQREALCTLGNGYFATRGAAEESPPADDQYPGTYLAGGYNRLKTRIADREIENEDLINWPNWLPLTFRCDEGKWFDLSSVEVILFNQELDFKNGLLKRNIKFKDEEGREFELKTLRLVSMDNPHVGAIQWTLKSSNWSGILRVRSHLWIEMKNKGVRRYQDLSNKHIEVRHMEILSNNSFLVESLSNQSEILMSQAIRTTICLEGKICEMGGRAYETPQDYGQVFEIELLQDKVLTIEKVMTLFTSKDHSCSHPSLEARRLLIRLSDFDQILKAHIKQWVRLWSLCDIDLPGNPRETKLLRLHIFHLLQTVSFKSIDLDVGIPARGLHGEAYRGHIFWDEVYILPFLNLRVPEIARSLLMYRYRRLDEARRNATAEGFEGAMFPWQSGSNGEEASQLVHLNPKSGRWLPDETYKQRHINGVIVYNVWRYYQSTKDHEFLSFFGVEMVLEIARFWVSHLSFNDSRKRYDIKGVVGPDEFHTKYPQSESLGINNNAYTNYLASWSIRTAVHLYRKLADDRKSEIQSILSLREEDLVDWEEKSRRIFLPIKNDGRLEQFEGFEDLKELDWQFYRQKYGNIQRIDRILEAEGDSVNCYKVNKQCDVLMLYYLFSPEELSDGFSWLNYSFDEESIPRNIDYHLALSTNGSTLSRIVHAWVLSRYDVERSWQWFNRALESDIADLQGGTTQEGIHLGAMAGTVDLVQRCFAGIEVRHDILWINPHLPSEIRGMTFRIRFRGHALILRLVEDILYVKIERCWIAGAKIGYQDQIYDFKQGDEFRFEILRKHEEDHLNPPQEESML